MNGDEHGIHEAQHPNLRELERERRRLLKARDVDGLIALAARVRSLPPSAKHDRLLYAVEQNANFAARVTSSPGARGLAIGATIIAAIIGGGAVAIGVFASEDAGGPYSFRNDTGSARLIRRCDDTECRFPGATDRVAPGETVRTYDEGVYLIADESGKTLGCTVSPYDLTMNLSEHFPCPPGAPKQSG